MGSKERAKEQERDHARDNPHVRYDVSFYDEQDHLIERPDKFTEASARAQYGAKHLAAMSYVLTLVDESKIGRAHQNSLYTALQDFGELSRLIAEDVYSAVAEMIDVAGEGRG